jgi:hypothetical protein
MAERRGRGGRPSKGQRDLFVTRPPMEDADKLRDLADELGMTLSDTLAALLRIGLRHLGELPAPSSTKQKELPLIQAS